MARRVDIMAGPLSEQDRNYLEQRGRRHLILQNDRQFPGGVSNSAPQSSDDEEMTWDEEVDQLTVEELKTELSERDLPVGGNKAELQQRLKDAGPED